MHRHMMMAALIGMGAASIVPAPTCAQDHSPQRAKKATESAPVSSAVAPSPRLGTKRSATSQDGPELQSQKATRPLTLSPGGAPHLPAK